MGEGDLVRAERMLKEPLSTYSSSYPLVEVLRKAVLAFILSSTGRVTQGRGCSPRASRHWDQAGLRSNRVTFLYDAALARFAAHSGDRTRTRPRASGLPGTRRPMFPRACPSCGSLLMCSLSRPRCGSVTLPRRRLWPARRPILAKAPQAGYLGARLEALSTANPEIKDRPGEDALTTAELRVLVPRVLLSGATHRCRAVRVPHDGALARRRSTARLGVHAERKPSTRRRRRA